VNILNDGRRIENKKVLPQIEQKYFDTLASQCRLDEMKLTIMKMLQGHELVSGFLVIMCIIKETSLDFNYVKPCFDLLQFKYNFITLGQKDFLI